MTAPAITLLPYQKRWLANRQRFKLGMFARQTGKTFSATLELVDDCFEAESNGRRTTWVILSRGERQAKEAIGACTMHATAYNMGIKEIASEFRGDDGAVYKQLEVVLPGGSRIIGLPANPDTARGFSANVFLDEFAFHRDSRAIWKALFPVISRGYKLRVVSTPNGKSNKFYDLLSGGRVGYANPEWLASKSGQGADLKAPDQWYRQVIDIAGAVNDGLDFAIDEMRSALDDEDAWGQEYDLQWLDEASAWLPYDLINSVEDIDAGLPDRARGGACYIGNDIGRKKDLWVAWVIEQIGDVFWTREVKILKNATFAAQDSTLDALILQYNPVRVCMDQTGMGEKPVEDAQWRHGRGTIEGVMFTVASKLVMATHAKQVFQDRRIRIPMGDTRLRADLHSLRKVSSATGAPRFLAESDSETDSHADRAWALFLALHAASTPPVEMDWTAAPAGNAWAGARPSDEDDNDNDGGLRLPGGSW